MKSIREELQEAFQKVADYYGVIINDVKIEWLNVDSMDGEQRLVCKLTTGTSQLILPVKK